MVQVCTFIGRCRGIATPPVKLFPSLRSASPRRKLWLIVAAAAVYLSTVLFHATVIAREPGPPASHFGLDFIAFYTGGSFVNQGRADQLFDLKAIQVFQRQLAEIHGVKLGDALGPWWNPPFYAWIFSPLARLPFPTATRVWIGINFLSAAAAVGLLVRVLPRGCGWRTWSLIPAAMVVSVPFIHAITHGQNACTSLLLVMLTVTAWRAGRGIAAGLVAGLMFYKPQLGLVVATMLVVSLGWRALVGIGITGSILLIVTLKTLPGSLGRFLHQMPLNVKYVQEQAPYLWDRHATFKAFWRLLIQGSALGPMHRAAAALAAMCMAAVAVALVRVSPLRRWIDPFEPREENDEEARSTSRDRLIAATIAATPLLMPFYFDYDLLLLAIPAVLYSNERMRRGAEEPLTRGERALPGLWAALYGWMLVNADVAALTRVNLAVPMLAGVAGLLIVRVRGRATIVRTEVELPQPLARAA